MLDVFNNSDYTCKTGFCALNITNFIINNETPSNNIGEALERSTIIVIPSCFILVIFIYFLYCVCSCLVGK